jgi:hypothetical protein
MTKPLTELTFYELSKQIGRLAKKTYVERNGFAVGGGGIA